MAIIFDSLLLEILLILPISIVVFYKWKFLYWKKLGVEYLEPELIFGNLKEAILRKISTGQWLANFYQFLKDKKLRYGGIYSFHMPQLVLIDPDLIKHGLQIDFVHFMDHPAYINEKDDPLSAHLFALGGQRWRKLRTKLSPTFTSGKMKNMFPTIVEISKELVKVIKKESQSNKPFEAKEISARFTTDVIGNCAFGLECNSLADPNTEFRIKGKRIVELTPFEGIKTFLCFVIPDIMKLFNARFFPKPATDFFWNIIKDTTEYREENNVRRNDFTQLLLDMKNSEEIDTKITFNELAAQAFVFYLAGFDTSSTLMSFALLELAANEDVQSILRNEVVRVMEQNNGEITYESLNNMHYLDMVINETLRKYPPVPLLSRVCTRDYQVPNSNVLIKKGIIVSISIQGIHYDEEYYPNPQKFIPTRFDQENKSRRHQFTFLPFGEGPRICIGLRFGVMQAKIGLASIVKNFRIKLNPQTTLPIQFDPKNFFTGALEGLWVNFEAIH